MTDSYGPGMPRVLPRQGDREQWERDVNAAIAAALGAGQTWRQEAPGSVSLTITCPRCEHLTDIDVDTVIGVRGGDAAADYEIVCSCREGHVAEDPKKPVAGCGFGRSLLIHLEHPPEE